MEEILQLITWLNVREQSGASPAEIRERTALIQQLAPGFQVVYWNEIGSWVLIPMSAIPERFHP
ncbi:MAG TPA: hypothetical protein VKV19_11480 [Ktedonobacteraceae bacterium]|nr:hypothetical protein [Ktedonobacteraceae bacterium]